MANAQDITELSAIVRETESLQDMANEIEYVLERVGNRSIQAIQIGLKSVGTCLPNDSNIQLVNLQDPINVAFLQDLLKLLNMSISTRKLTYNLPYGE